MGWSGARVAQNAVRILERLPAAHRMSELFVDWEEPGAAKLKKFVRDGAESARWVLKDAHGDRGARAVMPSVSAVMHWCLEADKLSSPLPALDPGWCGWWQGQGQPLADISGMGPLTSEWDGQLLGQEGERPRVPAKPA